MDPFEDVYRRHFAGVWAALQRLGVERADLEDAVQDVFVVAHRRRAAFTGTSSMRAWLLGISRRVASDHRRRHRRHLRRIDGLRPLEPGLVEPDDVLWRTEGARLLHGFLATLEDGKREIFVLVELEQLTGREAASILGLNRNTAVARLRAARRAFDEYARRCQQSPSRLLIAARRVPPPEPQVQRRVSSLLMLRLGVGGAEVAPTAGMGSLGTWKAAAVSLAIAGASLGGIGLAAAAWRPPPRIASVASNAAPSLAPVDAGRSEVVVGLASESPVSRAPPVAVVATSPRRVTASSSPTSARGSDPVSAKGEPEDVDPLQAQARALRGARIALRDGDPERALAIATAAIEAHGSGGLVSELALVRIGALCARGQRAQARGEALVLQRSHPGSPVAARAGCPEPDDP